MRPTIQIPPRKRRRLQLELEEGDITYTSSDHQITFGDELELVESDASFDPGNEEQDVERSDDAPSEGSREPSIEDAESAEVEAAAEIDRLSPAGLEVGGTVRELRPRKKMRITRGKPKSIQGRINLPLADDKGRPFPGLYQNPLLDQYEKTLSRTATMTRQSRRFSSLANSHHASENKYHKAETLSQRSSRRSDSKPSHANKKNVSFQSDQVPAMSEELALLSHTESDDGDFNPPGDINVPPLHRRLSKRLRSRRVPANKKATGSQRDGGSSFKPGLNSPTDSDSDDFQPDNDHQNAGTPNSGDLSDSKDSISSSNLSSLSPNPSSSSSSSSYSSSSTSASESEHEATRPASLQAVDTAKITRNSAVNAQHPDKSRLLAHISNPPGSGSVATSKRNQRRRNQKKLKHLKRTGILPSDATQDDLRIWQSEGQTANSVTPDGQFDKPGHPPLNDALAEFETRRQKLLASIASGGVELVPEGEQGQPDSTILRDQQGSSRPDPQSLSTREDPEVNFPAAAESETSLQLGADKPKTQPRARLNIASSRRMLLNSLGLRNPKSKEDEDALRSSHKREAELEARRHQAPALQTINGELQTRTTITTMIPASSGAGLGNGYYHGTKDDGWREKIILSAVECCESGVILSTPPYPFVQRWDPQQKLSRSERRKGGKKRKWNQPRYYESEGQHTSTMYDYGADADADIELPYDDLIEGLANGAPRLSGWKAITQSTNEVTNDAEDFNTTPIEGSCKDQDILEMPLHSEKCPELHQVDIRSGAVIGFKQLIMAADWQPEISSFRTARVEKLLEDGSIQLTLAKRDRPNEQKKFDEAGQRIYGKFEVPDQEDSQEVANGLLEMVFSDLIEPKLLQPAAIDATVTKAQDISELTLRNLKTNSGESEARIIVGGAACPVSGFLRLIENGEKCLSSATGTLSRSDPPANSSGEKSEPVGEIMDELEPPRSKELETPQVTTERAGTGRSESPKVLGLGLEPPSPAETSWDQLFSMITASGAESLLQSASSQPAKGSERSLTAQGEPSGMAQLPNGPPLETSQLDKDGDLFMQESPKTPVEEEITGSELRTPSLSYRPPVSAVKTGQGADPAEHEHQDRYDGVAQAQAKQDVKTLSLESDLPSLDDLFAMFGTSLGPVKDENESTNAPQSQKAGSQSEPPPADVANDTASSQSKGLDASSGTTQHQASSGVVDLTQSSDEDAFTQMEDPYEYSEEEYDPSLPSGRGWIQKVRSLGRNVRRSNRLVGMPTRSSGRIARRL